MEIEQGTLSVRYRLTKPEVKLLVEFASKDDSRYSLNGIAFGPRGSASTDGHRLAVVDASGEIPNRGWPDCPIIVRLALVRQAMALRSQDGLDVVADSDGNVSVWRGSIQTGKFNLGDKNVGKPPPFGQVLPERSDDEFPPSAYAINAKYLSDVELMQDCLGQDRHDMHVVGTYIKALAREQDPVMYVGRNTETRTGYACMIMTLRA